MMQILRALNIADLKKKDILLQQISDSTLETLYCESVEFKKAYPLAYERLSNEFNMRKSMAIEQVDAEYCAALEHNAAPKGNVACKKEATNANVY